MLQEDMRFGLKSSKYWLVEMSIDVLLTKDEEELKRVSRFRKGFQDSRTRNFDDTVKGKQTRIKGEQKEIFDPMTELIVN